MRRKTDRRLWLAVVVIVLAAIVLPRLLAPRGDQPLVVVYCAHDSVFADGILQQFRQRTGIRVQVRYDEEASKSLGLTNLLIAEKASPRCDVFWNNQSLGTMRLKEHDVLAVYKGPGYERIPQRFRDPDGCWTGFAARLRVFIVNTDMMTADQSSIQKRLTQSDLSQVAIAKPLFGTTLTHYSVLASERELDGLKTWHRSLRDRGIREVRGNSAVKDLVAEGICDLGFTDTDDAFAAIDQGKHVRMVPVRTESGATICIPNTVAMIRNCPHPEAARQFIDFLLSADVELQLARSRSRQIPIGVVPEQQLPAEVRRLLPFVPDGADLRAASAVHQDVLDWLTSEYLP
jgi:iron(III) transport system substrate-binding protein